MRQDYHECAVCNNYKKPCSLKSDPQNMNCVAFSEDFDNAWAEKNGVDKYDLSYRCSIDKEYINCQDYRNHTRIVTRAIEVWGDMLVGTPEQPMLNPVSIQIWGVKNHPSIVMTEGAFMYNKVIGVLGRLSLYGAPHAGGVATKLFDPYGNSTTTKCNPANNGGGIR